MASVAAGRLTYALGDTTAAMIFGDPKDFAIEVFHEPLGPTWIGFGRMALHVQSVVLGDIQADHCGLADAVERLRELTVKVHERWDPSFSGHSDEEIFALIDRELYVDYGQTDVTVEDGLRRYGRFDFLTNAGEQFDDVKTFIYVEPRGTVHILYQTEPTNSRAVTCSIDSFRSASLSFLDWFDREVRMGVSVA